jgi:hypothetical protein
MELKQLSNDQKSFGLALKRFLFTNSFYTMNEYFNYNCTHIWEFGYMLFYVLMSMLYCTSYLLYHISIVFFINNVHVWLLHYCKCIIYCDGNHIHDVFLKDLWWTNKWMNEYSCLHVSFPRLLKGIHSNLVFWIKFWTLMLHSIPPLYMKLILKKCETQLHKNPYMP